MSRLRYHLVGVATLLSPLVMGMTGASAAAPDVDGITVEGTTLKLTKNVSTCLEIGAGDNYTLDLSGFTLTGAAAGCNTIWVHNGGSLTITGTGTVTNTVDSLYPVILNDNGRLVIEGGSFVSENVTPGRFTPVVDTKTGETTISGGTFLQKGAYNAVMGEGAGITTISGGTFTNQAGKWAGVIGNLEDKGSTINISGDAVVNAYNDGWTVINFNGNTMNIAGGTFNGVVGQYNTIEPGMVTGGTFTTNPMEATYYGEVDEGEYGFIKVNAVADTKIARENDEGKYVVVDKPVALSAITLDPTEVKVALNDTVSVAVSYNEGFLNSEIDSDIEATTVAYKSGADNITYASFEATWDGEERVSNFDSIYFYGYEVGTAVYTVKVTDKSGNVATKDITVTVEDALKRGGDYVVDDEGGSLYGANAEFKTPVEGGREISVKAKTLADELKDLDDNLKMVLDITVKDKDGKTVDVVDNEITVTAMVKKSLVGNATKFQIVYIKDGKIVEYIDPSQEPISQGDYWYIIFKTTHLSEYGVLASTTDFTPAEERNELIAPDTGAFTSEAGSSVNFAVLMAVVSLMTFAMIALEVVMWKKSHFVNK